MHLVKIEIERGRQEIVEINMKEQCKIVRHLQIKMETTELERGLRMNQYHIKNGSGIMQSFKPAVCQALNA